MRLNKMIGQALLIIALPATMVSAQQAASYGAKPKPAAGDKSDVSKADPAERESKRTEVWPHDYAPPASVTWVKDVVYGSPGGREIQHRHHPKVERIKGSK